MTLASTLLITFKILKKSYFQNNAATSTRTVWFY